MIGRSVALFAGISCILVAACQGGGGANNFGSGPSDNAPTDPGSPSDPGASPRDPNTPPFGDVAPRTPDGPSTTPGGGGPTGPDCPRICNQLGTMGCFQEDGDVDECVAACADVPGECEDLLLEVYECYVEFECDPMVLFEECGDEIEEANECVNPEPDPPDPPQDGG